MKRIFISSTFQDLQEFRQAVSNAVRRLDCIDISMEHFGARNAYPKDECLRLIREKSDLYVGIFAKRYGFIPPNDTRSMTHNEYREAIQVKIPCLIYLLQSDVTWPETYTDQGEAAKKLDELKIILQNRHICGYFSSPDDLAAKAAADIGRELSRGLARTAALQDEYFRDDERESRLIQDLESADRFKAKRAITALARTKSVWLVHTLKRLMIDADEDLAEVAVDGLSAIGSTEACKALSSGFLSPSVRIKKWVAFSIGELGLQKKMADSQPIISILVDVLNNPTEDIGVLIEVGHAICKFGEPNTIEPLLKALHSEKMPYQLKARLLYSAPKFFQPKDRGTFLQASLALINTWSPQTRAAIRENLKNNTLHPAIHQAIRQ